MTRRPSAARHEEFYRTAVGREVLGVEVQMLLDRLPGHGRALSVGCGIGVHEAELAARRPGLRVICLDLQREMLAMAPPSLERVRADVTSLPLREGVLDAAYMITALEFVTRPERALAEVVRVLRPGGGLVILALNPASRWGLSRLREVQASWGTVDALRAMVARASGSPVDVTYALNLEDEDRLREARGRDDAALLVLVSRKARHKS